jgi:hypothetical protein
LAQAYSDRPIAELEAADAAPHYRAANACLDALPLSGPDTTPQSRGAFVRIEDAMHALATYESDDVLSLMLHLVAILDGPPLPAEPSEAPRPLTADSIRQRLAERLISCWPRMIYADHANDVAASLTDDILLIVTQLQHQASAWRSQADRALAQRDRARTTAATLEQITAEATRLLLAGQAGPALAVLQSEGQPLGPCGAIEVVALDLHPHIAEAMADAEREAAGVEVVPDCGRDLDDEE